MTGIVGPIVYVVTRPKKK